MAAFPIPCVLCGFTHVETLIRQAAMSSCGLRLASSFPMHRLGPSSFARRMYLSVRGGGAHVKEANDWQEKKADWAPYQATPESDLVRMLQSHVTLYGSLRTL